MNEQFSRSTLLWGAAAQETLRRSHVLVLGLGGVGSYAVEALVRAGIGELTLVDCDNVALTNLNRQLEALHSTLGLPKAEAIAARARDINPDLLFHTLCATYDAAHRADFFPVGCHYDYIVDAIDLVSCKLDLIETAQALHIPILSALGTGNKRDPSRLELTDLSKTYGCPLARVMRKELRRRGILHLDVVFSPEEAAQTQMAQELPPPGRRSIPASNPWVPASAGLLLASRVVQNLIEKEASPC